MTDFEQVKQQIEACSDEQIWNLFAHVNSLLKNRGLVRTRNIVGERGEFLAIATYNATPGLPKLHPVLKMGNRVLPQI